MRNLNRILLAVLIAGMLVFTGSVAAEVDWTDSVTDPAGDAEADGTANPARTDADILSVSITEDGDDLNITMVLAGEYNSNGTYTVSVEVDGDKSFSFSRYLMLGFSAMDDDMNPISVDGYYSEDGTTLSWVVAKTDLDATSKVEIEYAMAMIVDMMGTEPTYTDYAGFGGAGSFPMPGSMDVLMYMPKLNKLEMKATMVYKGDNASSFRELMDGDSDGTVSAAEVDAFEDDMGGDDDANVSEANVTLDGKDPTDMVWDYSIEGAQGAVDSTEDVKIKTIVTLTFPEVEDKDSHEIAFDEPFGDDFMDIGEMTGAEGFHMTFKLRAPDGWTLKGGSLPAKMKDYLNDDGDEVMLEGDDLVDDWNATFGKMQTFTIEKSNGTPGFGLTLALGATLLAALVVSRRRR